MIDLVIFLKNNLAEHFVIYFIPLYIVGGRPVAILSAQFLGYKASFLLPVVVMLDTLQIPLFYHLYGAISGSLLARKFSERTIKKGKSLSKSKLFRWMQVMGAPGVVAITMLPLKGCGMWSGVLLSRLLKFSRPTGYPLLIGVSIFGCAFILGLVEGILIFWMLFING